MANGEWCSIVDDTTISFFAFRFQLVLVIGYWSSVMLLLNRYCKFRAVTGVLVALFLSSNDRDLVLIRIRILAFSAL